MEKQRTLSKMSTNERRGTGSAGCDLPGAAGGQRGQRRGQPALPPYVGHHGWIGAWLDVMLDWSFVAQIIRESYLMTAPKRLGARLEQG